MQYAFWTKCRRQLVDLQRVAYAQGTQDAMLRKKRDYLASTHHAGLTAQMRSSKSRSIAIEGLRGKKPTGEENNMGGSQNQKREEKKKHNNHSHSLSHMSVG